VLLELGAHAREAIGAQLALIDRGDPRGHVECERNWLPRLG